MKFDPIAPFRILLLGLVLAGIATAPASAQSRYAQTKLEAFVTAASMVKEQVRQWTPRIRSAGKGEQVTKLTAEANAEFIASIEKTDDITVVEYKEIAKAAIRDPALMEQLRQIFATRAKKP